MTFKYEKTLVSIGAENVEQICQFYQALLNQPPSIYRESIYAEFNLSGLVLAIFKPRPNEHDEFFNEEHKGGLSICFLVENLQQIINHLVDLGYKEELSPKTTRTMKELYIYDPEGNRIIFYQYVNTSSLEE